MAAMLGRLRRTTRTDVGLALAFVGVAYLAWALVAGVTRALVGDLISFSDVSDPALPLATRVVRVVFVDAGVAIDVAGILWLTASLLLVLRSSRQRLSISWPWFSALAQTLVAAIGGTLAAWAVHLPYCHIAAAEAKATPLERISGISLPVLLVLALLVWVTFLVLLLVERARLNRHGPSPSDGLRAMYR
jgi:hypothetical protein